MGIGGISIWQLLIVALIIVLLFGTKKLRGMGGDLGSAIKGFKKAVNEEDKDDKKEDEAPKQLKKEKDDATFADADAAAAKKEETKTDK